MASISPTGIAPVLQVHPSRRCNLACAHCYSMSGPAVREDLSLEVLSGCLEDSFELGYRQLSVSGGEPLLYKPLAGLLSCARRLGMITTLTSNGMLITPERWSAVAPLVDLVAISIDGRPCEHDVIRCQDGAFARTVANFKVIRSSAVPFGIIFTLTQHNLDSLEFVVRLAAENGARTVQVHPLTLHGRAAIKMTGARPDGIELVAALVEAERLSAAFGVPVQVDALTAAQLLKYREHVVPRRPVTNLVDAAPVLIVEGDGVVMPMTHELSRVLQMGSLANARLLTLANEWLQAGHGDEIAEACERTWVELTATNSINAVYWYDEVAFRTQATRSLRALTV